MVGNEFSPSVRQAIVDREEGRCAMCGRPTESLHLHHRRLRSQGGQGTVENGVGLCYLCHGWVHSNPTAAGASGYIVWLWFDSPSEARIKTWRGWVYFLEDGTWCPAGD